MIQLEQRRLAISTAPFVHGALSTDRLMFEVLLSLVPIVAIATYYFGISALLVVGTTTVAACATEAVFSSKRRGLGSLKDGSALLTGVLLALTLPPATPLWMAFLGGVVAIGLGKVLWGGLGRNLFNPALVGRAFLQASFPAVTTTWTAPAPGFLTVSPSTFAAPLMHASVDAVSAATPLGLAKFEGHITEAGPLLFGDIGGCLGETAGLALIICGIYLAARRAFDWRLPVATLVSVAVLSGVAQLVVPGHPGPVFMLLSGGLLFGSVYMVTDPVTSPITPRGAWIFGLGTGLLVVLIRYWGGLVEGVMFAILLMNSVTPLINRYTQPRRFGG